MFVFEMGTEAFRSLSRHKLRSLLTMLGMVFGVASVLSMVAIGEGARRAILDQIEELGITNVIVNAKKPPEEQDVKDEEESRTLRYGLTFRDARQIAETLPMVEAVLPVHDVEKWIWFKSRRISANVRGVTPEYFSRLNLDPILGRTLEDLDDIGRRRVCVIRSRLLDEAKYVGDPLKLDLKIGMDYYRVVGVLPNIEFQDLSKSALGIDTRTMDVYVPYQAVMGRFGITSSTERSGTRERTRVELHQLVCSVDTEANVVHAARGIQAILTKFHEKRDYEIIVPLELLASKQRAQQVFNIVLPVIAGISLLVGGIGILNIMLASITERTAEIGIRRAIGASQRDIIWQFLIETVTLAVVGGLIGVLVGVAGIHVLKAATQWHAALTPGALVLSMGVSCLTGIVFGLYPANRAAAMNPIDALRHG